MFTSNSCAVATPSRDSEADFTLHESLPPRGSLRAATWLSVLLDWHLRGFLGRAFAWFLQIGARLRGRGDNNVPRSPKSPKSRSSYGHRRWWSMQCRRASSFLTQSVSSKPASLVTTQTPLKPAEDKPKDYQKDVSQDVAPSTPMDFQPLRLPSSQEVAQKKQPMLPTEALHRQVSPAARMPAALLPIEALHRIVSPAAQSMAASEALKTPTMPKLMLPAAAFARAPVYTPEPELDTHLLKRSQRKKTTRVSFMESAEWVEFNLDQPTSPPVVKTRPAYLDVESPRSPRPSQIKSSSLSFHETCGESVSVAMHNSNDPTLKEAMLSAATPKASSANPYALGFCNASNDLATYDFEPTAATPKAGLPTQLSFTGFTSLEESPLREGAFSLCSIPKAGSSSSTSFGFFDESPPDDCTTPKAGSPSSASPSSTSFGCFDESPPDDCTTPKAGYSSPTSFGFFDESPPDDCTTPKAGSSSAAQFSFSTSSPADFGDGSQSDSDSADTPSHDECQERPEEASPSTGGHG